MNEAAGTPDLAHVDVRYVAELARIALTDDEAERFQNELDDIVAYVALLDRLDLDDIEPTAHAAARLNVMRRDAVTDTLSREWVIDNAPGAVDDCYVRVPPVFDEGAP